MTVGESKSGMTADPNASEVIVIESVLKVPSLMRTSETNKSSAEEEVKVRDESTREEKDKRMVFAD